MSKHIVWIRYSENTPECYRGHNDPIGVWIQNGDGPMGQKTAERIAREIPGTCPGVQAKALPVGQEPNN